MPKICKNCNKEFPNRKEIDGKMRSLTKRKYCLECSPFGQNNTRQLHKTDERWEKENVQKAIKASVNYSECVRKLGLSGKAPGNRQTLKKYISKYDIDLSHFTFLPRYENRNPRDKTPLNEVLTKNSYYDNSSLKKRLLEKGLFQKRCSDCGLTTHWNGKPLTLQVDHINGVSTDNRIENLRLLCPNCHSQTPTWGSKNMKTTPSNTCEDCNIEISSQATRCQSCASEHFARTCPPDHPLHLKFDPTPEKLKKLVWEMPMTQVGEKFKVSSNAIKKRCKKYGIKTPGRGYWQKKKAGKIK